MISFWVFELIRIVRIQFLIDVLKCNQHTVLYRNCDRNSDWNEFHFIEKSVDYLSCDLFWMTNRMTNWTKIECASIKYFSQKSVFLCRCDQISSNCFETKICSIMYKKTKMFLKCKKNAKIFSQLKNLKLFN